MATPDPAPGAPPAPAPALAPAPGAWTKDQVERMMALAEALTETTHVYENGFEADNYVKIKCLTRDGSAEYFNEIMIQKKGIMQPILKDDYGSRQNPINGTLSGLWFGAYVKFKTGNPYPTSMFGPKRLQLPARKLINTDYHLYFSDFYCMASSPSDKHNILLVLCKPESVSDKFCKEYLVPLQINNNPFLSLDEDDIVWITTRAYVVLFYAEPMNIKEKLKDVKCPGDRSSNPHAKNLKCKICNLPKKRETEKRGREERDEKEDESKRR